MCLRDDYLRRRRRRRRSKLFLSPSGYIANIGTDFFSFLSFLFLFLPFGSVMRDYEDDIFSLLFRFNPTDQLTTCIIYYSWTYDTRFHVSVFSRLSHRFLKKVFILLLVRSIPTDQLTTCIIYSSRTYDT